VAIHPPCSAVSVPQQPAARRSVSPNHRPSPPPEPRPLKCRPSVLSRSLHLLSPPHSSLSRNQKRSRHHVRYHPLPSRYPRLGPPCRYCEHPLGVNDDDLLHTFFAFFHHREKRRRWGRKKSWASTIEITVAISARILHPPRASLLLLRHRCLLTCAEGIV